MATTPEQFMIKHLEDFKKEALKAPPDRRRQMIAAIVLATSDVLADKDLPHEPLSMLTSYIDGVPGDASLYQNLSATMEVLTNTITHHSGTPEGSAQVMKALVVSSLMARALCAASVADKDEVYMPASWGALLDAMNLSNLVGGLPRFASAWQHRLGGIRSVTGFFVGSAGSA